MGRKPKRQIEQILERFVSKMQIIEADQKKLPQGVLCRVVYPICNIGEVNKNKRVYDKAVWEQVAGDPELQEKIKSRSLFGHAEHPKDTSQSSTEKISHVVNNIWLDEATNAVKTEIDVLDTPYGRICDSLLKAGCGLGVSTRAEGELEEAEDSKGDKYFKVVPQAYKLRTIDFTADPSTYGAYPESVERDLVGIVKKGVDDGKVDQDYATVMLESMKTPEAKTLLENITHDLHHKDCKCKTSEKQCTHGCPKATSEGISKEEWTIVHDAVSDVVDDFEKITKVDPVTTIDPEGSFHQDVIDKTIEPVKAYIKKEYPELAANDFRNKAWEDGFLVELDDKLMDRYADAAVAQARKEGKLKESHGFSKKGEVPVMEKEKIKLEVIPDPDHQELFAIKMPSGKIIIHSLSKEAADDLLKELEGLKGTKEGFAPPSAGIPYEAKDPMSENIFLDMTGYDGPDAEEKFEELQNKLLAMGIADGEQYYLGNGPEMIFMDKEAYEKAKSLLAEYGIKEKVSEQIVVTAEGPDEITFSIDDKKYQYVGVTPPIRDKFKKMLSHGARFNALHWLNKIVPMDKRYRIEGEGKDLKTVPIKTDEFFGTEGGDLVRSSVKESLNEKQRGMDFETLYAEMQKVWDQIGTEEERKALNECKTVVDLHQRLTRFLMESRHYQAISNASVEKLTEILKELENKYTKDVLSFNEQIESFKKQITQLTEDHKKNVSRLTEEHKQAVQKLQETSLKEKEVLGDVLLTKVKDIYEKKIEETKQHYEAELLRLKAECDEAIFQKTVVDAKIKESGLNLPDNAIHVLRQCKNEAELDDMISRFRFAIKESLLHSNTTEIKLKIEDTQGPVNPLLVTTKNAVELLNK